MEIKKCPSGVAIGAYDLQGWSKRRLIGLCGVEQKKEKKWRKKREKRWRKEKRKRKTWEKVLLHSVQESQLIKAPEPRYQDAALDILNELKGESR